MSLARHELIRRAADSRTGRRARRVLRQARMFHERGRFVVAGMLELDGIHPYRLRRDGRRLWLRHPVDSWTLHDVLVKRVYELPAQVRAALPPASSVLDLGANVGLFGVFALKELEGCRVTGYEPDPANARVLELTLASELRDGRYRLVRAAAGATDGEARFALGLGDRSHQASDGVTVPMHDVLPAMAGADLAKIDIEGGEWPLLSDSRLRDRGPRAIVLEYHSEGCPEPNPREAAEQLLRDAGYRIVDPAHRDDAEPDQGMLWALRRHPVR